MNGNYQIDVYNNLDNSRAKKIEQFPLEHSEECLPDIFLSLSNLKSRIVQSKKHNALSRNPKKTQAIDKALFKVNTILSLLDALIKDIDKLKV